MKTAKHIADRIRLFIATKQFQVGDIMPSTRELGRQLDASFHTVRKAYHQLAKEGMLRSERGRGFIVNRQNIPLDKSQRLEMGAGRIRSVLEELIGNGLDEDEIETLFQEQLGFIDWPERLESCASAGMTLEHASMISKAIANEVGIKSDQITPDEHSRSVNYDAIFVPVQLMRHFREGSENILLLPIVYQLKPDVLISLVERSSIQSIGLVTAEEKTINVLIDELKFNLKFSGSIVAGTVYGKSLPLFVREVDVVLYPPALSALVERQIPENKRMKLDYQLDKYSADIIRAELWDQ
ncbi:GntR family transcriptional regulator [Balneolaceae bacterium ANBcel3]|nr:GntR family transcriptional regulator [Balneolaceae bacterium ANBcel3]